MKLLVQVVKEASVTVASQKIGSIEEGLLVFLGISSTDTLQEVSRLVKKLVDLRIFKDSQHKMNLSIKDTQGSILLVSQFTLYADCEHSRRPSFTEAASADQALPLYRAFITALKDSLGSSKVATGEFGSYMQVSLINDGPSTFILT